MSRRAYKARRAQRANRVRAEDGNGMAHGRCAVCNDTRPLVATTGLCRQCTADGEAMMQPIRATSMGLRA